MKTRKPLSLSITAADTPKPISFTEIIVKNGIMVITAHPCYIGDGTRVDTPLNVGGNLKLENVDLRDLFVKNKNAGNDSVLKITGWG